MAAETTPRARLRPATSAEAEELYGWILGWSAWFREQQIAQWHPPYPEGRFAREVEADEVLCLDTGEEVRGMVTISRDPPDYHPDHLWDETPAWYVCRVTVPPCLRGTGAGAELLAAVEAAAARDGVRRLRIDVAETNPFLVDYWERRGFRTIEQGLIRGGAVVFMEKNVRP